jgi:hypothetical protein
VRLQKATDEREQLGGGFCGRGRRAPLRAGVLGRPKLCSRQVLEQNDQRLTSGRGVGAADSQFEFLHIDPAFGGCSPEQGDGFLALSIGRAQSARHVTQRYG